MSEFEDEVAAQIAANAGNAALRAATGSFVLESIRARYSYNYSWLGRPIIQYPQDIVAMQELIWAVKPDLIVETGIAHGGSLILNASMLALLDMTDAMSAGVTSFDPRASRRKVIGVDIDIRAHNRAAIEAHPLASRIEMIQGSSIAPDIVATVRKAAQNYERVLVSLDSNHTHDHVLAELEAYAPARQRRQLLRRLRYRDRAPPGRPLPRPALVARQQSAHRRQRLPGGQSRVRDRQEHREQADDHRRSGRLLAAAALVFRFDAPDPE